MKKRAIWLILIFCFVLLFTISAAATGISTKGLNAAKLYELYAQVQAQIQLNKLTKLGSYITSPNYDDIERNPASHKNEKISFTGKILQVIEGSPISEYRIAMHSNSDKVFLVDYERPEDAERLLVGDVVSAYVTFKELQTYQSTFNLSVTVPYCKATLIVRRVTDKNVLSANNEELESALTSILDSLKSATPKDHGYIKLTKTNYDEFSRLESLHKNELIVASGTVLQVLEDTFINTVRLAVDSDLDKVLYLTVDPSICPVRVLENDTITVKGKSTGLYTYSSIRGGEITIPAAAVESLEVKGYTIPKNASKNKAGHYVITKKTYEDYARRPTVHLNESIYFTAKVLQVIEGSLVSAYRMAVDSDSDCVIYVTLPNSDRSVRILEDDKVNVIASFEGLQSYETTLGATVTIPKCSASSVTVPGKNASSSQKNSGKLLKITKKNYDSVARQGDANKDKPVSFKAEVVQVVDDDDQTIYRLAVDKSYDAIVLAIINNSDLSFRILEDDIVSIEGTSTGLYSYNSTLGGKITIPSCTITKYSVEGYKPVKMGAPDANGNLKITKANYSELARNPDPYRGGSIQFRGKVLQVVEGRKGNNIYRVAVDSDNDCVFYVEYTLPSGASRILEKDVVNLTGTYFGIYTYTTTLGSSVSVPALIADTIKK